MTEIRLDDSQAAVVSAEASDRLVVLAGPGSGKTEVVAARIACLTQGDHDLDPTSELIVISFSRAAVRAVNQRLRKSDVRASAAVRTLDGLAARIMLDCGEDPTSIGFDARIRSATRLVEKGTWEPIEDVRHLIVDEVQDVVGIRAEFLVRLVEHLPEESGFTLLGDPAQAIYDFQLGPQSSMTCSAMLALIAKRPGVAVRELTGSYRAATREARHAIALRNDVRLDLSNASVRVSGFLDSLVRIERPEDLGPLLQDASRTTALLTRTNGQSLVTAHRLWALGIPATVRRPIRQPVIGSWVAETLGTRSSWTRDEFIAAQPDEEIGVARWKALRTICRPRGAAIETRDVASALLTPWSVPSELVAEDAGGVVVSTIHRAKGLEFDTVVLVQFPDDGPDDDPARVRELYVAVTRARERLFRMADDSWYPFRRTDGDRWYCTNRKRRGTVRFEIRGEDTDRTAPPVGSTAGATQQVIRALAPGTPLDVELDPSSTMQFPVYRFLHEGVVVARTSTAFGEVFARQVGTPERRARKDVAWPGVGQVHVETVETVAGPPQAHGTVGAHGLWLGVRAVGFPWLVWEAEGR
jgi:hypothetical protein